MWIAIVLFGIAVLFMLIFRSNIAALIDRVKSFKVGDKEVQVGAPAQSPPDVKPDATEELMKAIDNPVVLREEDAIRRDLETRHIPTQDREKVLIRIVALTNLRMFFEGIYSLIWGSQIYVLEHLNGLHNGAPKSEVKKLFYDDAAAKYPLHFTAYPFEGYIGFLKNSKLVIEDGEILCITDLGVEFLAYLARTGRSLARFRPG
jgi:hypothetical protein